MTEAFYLTPSRISGALQCALRYHRQYVQKLEGGPPALAMFAGSMEHAALDRWGADGTDLLEAHQGAWFDEGPDGLVKATKGKDEEARRHFSAFGLYLHYRDKLGAVGEAERELAARIIADNPKVKAPRATKLFKEEAAKLDPGSVRTRLDQTIGAVDKWFYSGKSPWRPSGPSPFTAFVESEIALTTFAEWWTALGDAAPDIVHTEAKQRDIDPSNEGRFAMTGVIDAIYIWPDGSVEVVDYKRSAGREDDIAHFVQAATYALTCREIIGIPPARVAFHHLKEGQRLVYEVQPDWPKRLLGLAETVKSMHDRDSFPPSFRTCSWCEYASMCHADFEFYPTIQPARIEESAA